MQIAVCDDCAADRHIITQKLHLLTAEEGADIAAFADGYTLMERVNEGEYHPQVVFFDIEFAGLDRNGIDFALELHEKLPECQVVFITEYLHRAMDVYQAEHAYFVLKSCMDDYLPAAVRKIKARLKSSGEAILTLEQKGKTILINKRDIIFIESNLHLTRIQCGEQTYYVSEKLNAIEKRLDASDFVRCHISYLCSLSQVLELRRTELLLRGGQLVPISRNRYNDVKQSLARYLGGAL